MWLQGVGAEVPTGEVADLLPGQKRKELPRLLLLARGIVSTGKERPPPTATRDLSLSQSGTGSIDQPTIPIQMVIPCSCSNSSPDQDLFLPNSSKISYIRMAIRVLSITVSICLEFILTSFKYSDINHICNIKFFRNRQKCWDRLTNRWITINRINRINLKLLV